MIRLRPGDLIWAPRVKSWPIVSKVVSLNSGKTTRTSLAPIPADLLTASGSGLDPHLSPASISAQAPRAWQLYSSWNKHRPNSATGL